MKTSDRDRLIRQGARSALPVYRRLAAAIDRARRWQDDGYPNGTGGVRGGESDPLPLRKVLAGPDQIEAKILDIHRTLVMWAELGGELEAFIAWTETVARHEDDRPTLTCRHCTRTILDGWDALYERLDKPKAGLCTYRVDDIKGEGKVFVEGGCHAPWLEAKREQARIRQANLRERRRVTQSEWADDVTCHAVGVSLPASFPALRPEGVES